MYILFLPGIILPVQLALVPLCRMVKDAAPLGSYTSMILFYTGLQAAFTIFVNTGFLRALPREYGEAALVDGATDWQSGSPNETVPFVVYHFASGLNG